MHIFRHTIQYFAYRFLLSKAIAEMFNHFKSKEDYIKEDDFDLGRTKTYSHVINDVSHKAFFVRYVENSISESRIG